MSRRTGALLAFLLSLLAYVATAAPSIWWLDSSEFAAASFELGIAHPPGHPLAALLGKLCTLLPLGSLAFRANLASALAAAAAAAVLFLIAWDLHGAVCEAVAERRGATPPPAPPWSRGCTALGAALLLSLCLSQWMQATRAEVYALNLLVLLVALERLLSWDRGNEGALGQAAFALGLGLGNHHLLVLLFALVALPWVLARRPWGRLWRWAAPGLLGMCVLLYLPLRAASWPEVDWGAPTTLGRLGWLVSARAFSRTAARVAVEPLAPRVEGVAWLPVAQLGIVGAAAALAGLYFLLRLRGTRRSGLLIAGAAAASAAGPLIVGFDPFNPDAHGYLLVLLASGAACAAAFVAGADAILRLAGRVRPARMLGPALLAAGLLQAARFFGDADLRGAWSAEETARQVAAAVPSGGVLHTALYKTAFNLWYLRIAEGFRPDLRHLHVGFLGFPGYRESIARRDPDLLGAPPDASEYYDEMSDAAVRRLGPAGPVLRVGGSVAEHRARMAALARLDDGGENEAGRALLFANYRAAQYFCRVGNLAEARREVAAARRRSTSPLLDELLARCR
jgi:transmembrane protein TMEM260 (protein O-mannosyltransferase)